VTLNGKLLTDDFYNGNVFEAGLRRYAPEILTGDLRVEILSLRLLLKNSGHSRKTNCPRIF
jgi:hypothetical protein